jgi:transcriptional regulator with XRE-family HTH domain
MSLLSENLKYLRKQKGFTQELLAEKLGIKRSLVGAYEEGRAEPGLLNLQKISQVFEVSIDNLISEDYTDPSLSKKLFQKDIEARKLRVLSITVDKDERENILLVPQKAAAGYLNGYADTEYVAELPKFYLPIFSNTSTYRAFEISGDSMLPLQPGTIIIGKYVDNWQQLKDEKTYILLTQDEGIVYKRVFNHIKTKNILTLVSDNPSYSPFDLPIENLLEAWEASAFISTNFPQAEMSIQKLTSMMIDLQAELGKLRQ